MSMKSTPFEFSEGYNLLMLNAEQGNLDEVRRIIQERKNLDVNQMNKKGYTSLALAVKSGNLAIVKELIAAGANVNIRNSSGQSPLFLACYHGFEDIARILLANGSTINTTDQRGWTPLMIAVYHSSVSIARLLLENDADVNIKDYYGKSALDRAKNAELQRLISEKLSTPRKHIENSNTKLHISSVQSPSAFESGNKQKKGKTDKFGAFSTPSNQHNRSFDNRTPQSLNPKASEPLPARSRSQSQKKLYTPSKSIGNGLRNTPQAQKENKSLASSNQKQNQNSGELQRLVSEQMDSLSQKIHNIITQRVNYEIPIHVQKYREILKAEAENAVSQRLISIISDLNNYFNMKLNYFLSKAGVDPHSIDLQPFLDSKEVQGLETGPILGQFDLDSEYLKRLEVMRHELEDLEAEALSQGLPINEQSWQQQAGNDRRADGFMSFGNRWQAKNELIDHINSELKNSADYLLGYSGDKIVNLIKDENQFLSKGLLSELSNTMDQLEEQIRHRFEDSISKRVNQITEALSVQPRSSSQFQKRSVNTSLLASTAGHPGGVSTSREKLRNELENVSSEEGTKSSASKSLGGAFTQVRNLQQDETIVNKRLNETRSKIQNIKNSLNVNFETFSPSNEVLNDSIKGMSRTAPNFSNSLSTIPSNFLPSQKSTNLQATLSKSEKEVNPPSKNLEGTANFGQEKFNANELKNYYKGQATAGGKQSGGNKQSDQKSGVPPHRLPANDYKMNYNFGKDDGAN